MSSGTPSPVRAEMKNTSSNRALPFSSGPPVPARRPAAAPWAVSSTLLSTRILRSGRWLSASEDAAPGSRAASCGASTTSRIASASCAPSQAAATIARSSRRLGSNRPGVSARMIWVSASPVFSSAMPISRARVVCALGLTIATFWPTSALTSVDLPALGAPMHGDEAAVGWVGCQNPAPEMLRSAGSRFRRPACSSRCLPPRRRRGSRPLTVNRAAWSGPERSTSRYCGILRRLPAAHSCSADLGCLACPARAGHGIGPEACGRSSRAASKPSVRKRRADQRLHHVAEDIVAFEPAVVARLLAEPDVFAKADRAGDLGADRAG